MLRPYAFRLALGLLLVVAADADLLRRHAEDAESLVHHLLAESAGGRGGGLRKRSLLQADIQCTGFASGVPQPCPADRPASKCCTPGEGGSCEDSAQVLSAGRCPAILSEFDCCTGPVSGATPAAGPTPQGPGAQTELACRDQGFGSSCPSSSYSPFCCDNASNRCREYSAAMMGSSCPTDRAQYSCCLVGPLPPTPPARGNGDLTCAAALANSTCPSLTPLRYCCDSARGLCHELGSAGGSCPSQRPQYSCCSTVTPLAPPTVLGSTSPTEQRASCRRSSGGPTSCQSPLTGACCSSADTQSSCIVFKGGPGTASCPSGLPVAMCCSQVSTLGLSRDNSTRGAPGLSLPPGQAPASRGGSEAAGAGSEGGGALVGSPYSPVNQTSGEGAWTCQVAGVATSNPFGLCRQRGLPEPKCCDGSTNLCLDYLAASFGTTCPSAMPLRCCKFNFQRRKQH